MGKTSSEVKDRWNKKTYDTVTLRLKKGQKQIISDHAAKKGESINGFINRAVAETIEREK